MLDMPGLGDILDMPGLGDWVNFVIIILKSYQRMPQQILIRLSSIKFCGTLCIFLFFL